MFTCNIDMPLWETNNCAITLAAAVQSSPQFVDFIDDINKLYQQKQESASLFLSFSCIFTFVLLYLILFVATNILPFILFS